MKERIKDIYWYFKCPNINNPSLPTSINSVLFICKGNICRSPFAEHVAKKIALENFSKKLVSCSAGLEVSVPLPSPIQALDVAEKFGVNLVDHKSRGISIGLAAEFDMIIAMESWHVKRLRENFGMFRDKIYLLPLFERNNMRRLWSYNRYNIADPYGKSSDYFQECFYRIEKCIYELFSKY